MNCCGAALSVPTTHAEALTWVMGIPKRRLGENPFSFIS